MQHVNADDSESGDVGERVAGNAAPSPGGPGPGVQVPVASVGGGPCLWSLQRRPAAISLQPAAGAVTAGGGTPSGAEDAAGVTARALSSAGADSCRRHRSPPPSPTPRAAPTAPCLSPQRVPCHCPISPPPNWFQDYNLNTGHLAARALP